MTDIIVILGDDYFSEKISRALSIRLYKAIDLYHELTKDKKKVIIICNGKKRKMICQFFSDYEIPRNCIVLGDSTDDYIINLCFNKRMFTDVPAYHPNNIYIIASTYNYLKIRAIAQSAINSVYYLIVTFTPRSVEDRYRHTEAQVLSRINKILDLYRSRGYDLAPNYGM